MLVLSRKLQQQIKIGDQITVTILKVKGNTVRVGIDAPRDVRVVRGELPREGTEVEAPAATIAVNDAIIEASEESSEIGLESQATQVIAFRVRRGADESPSEAAETETQVSAAHLPLRQIRDRFGAAPLKQLVASCATLAK